MPTKSSLELKAPSPMGLKALELSKQYEKKFGKLPMPAMRETQLQYMARLEKAISPSVPVPPPAPANDPTADWVVN